MIPGSFDYHRPGSVADAVQLLADLGEEARVVAGGHSLIPMMKLRMAQPEHLVDLQDVAELKGISVEGGKVTLGAMATQAAIIGSRELASACPILREAAHQIADPQVRALGTIGGNVANGDPGNDMPAVMQALDAVYLLRSRAGTREVRARGLLRGRVLHRPRRWRDPDRGPFRRPAGRPRLRLSEAEAEDRRLRHGGGGGDPHDDGGTLRCRRDRADQRRRHAAVRRGGLLGPGWQRRRQGGHRRCGRRGRGDHQSGSGRPRSGAVSHQGRGRDGQGGDRAGARARGVGERG